MMLVMPVMALVGLIATMVVPRFVRFLAVDTVSIAAGPGTISGASVKDCRRNRIRTPRLVNSGRSTPHARTANGEAHDLTWQKASHNICPIKLCVARLRSRSSFRLVVGTVDAVVAPVASHDRAGDTCRIAAGRRTIAAAPST